MNSRIFCEQCGRDNSTANAFCEGCGARLATPTASSPPPPPASIPSPAREAADTDAVPADGRRPGRRRRVLVGVALVALGATAGVVARDFGAFDFALGERFDATEVESFEEKAREEGRIVGDRAGFDRGFEEGEEEGANRGYQEGLAKGTKDGETRGYEGAGTSIREVVWSDRIDGFESGLCVNFTGTYFLESWRWEFEYPDGTVGVIDDTEFDRANDGWCYTVETLQRYTDTSRLYEATLTVYVTRDSLTDRWGPRRTPIG